MGKQLLLALLIRGNPIPDRRNQYSVCCQKRWFKKKKKQTTKNHKKCAVKFSLFIFVMAQHCTGSSLPSTGSILGFHHSAEESRAVMASFSPPHKTLYIIVVIITELVCWFSNNSLMLHGGGTNTAACGLELTAGEFLQRLHFKSYSLYPKLSRYICQGP